MLAAFAIRPIVKRDFHIHTSLSDGIHPPRKVVKILAKQGIREMSITDHESYKGIPDGMKEAQNRGIGFIPGIELSTSFTSSKQVRRTPHILGFGFELALAQRDREFNDYLGHLYEDMRRRCEEQCDLSVRHPFQITMGQTKTMSLSLSYADFTVYVRKIGGSFHSGQFVNALLFRLRKQVPGINIVRQPDVTRALIWQHDRSLEELRRKNPGIGIAPNPDFAAAYSAIKKKHTEESFMATQDAVSKILDFGGVPVLAHPGEKGNGVEASEIPEIIAMGIKGLEANSPKHASLENCNVYARIAGKNGLLVLGGTDFHGLGLEPGVQAGMFSTDVPIESDSIEEIFKRRS